MASDSLQPANGLSHVVGLGEPPLLEISISASLDRAAERWPAQEALVSVAEGRRLNWAELRDESLALAAALIDAGLKPGDRVGIWAPNCAGWTVTQFAAAYAGLVLVTINPAYRLAELKHALNLLSVNAVVAAERFKTSDYVGMLETLCPEIMAGKVGETRAAEVPSLRLLVKLDGQPRPGWADYAQFVGDASPAGVAEVRRIAATIDRHEAANVQFTSGTTGLPKGATLTHHNILNNGYMVGRAVGLAAGDRLCIPVPLYHCFGMVMGNLACVTHGATMVYPGPGFDAAMTLSAVEAERCTQLYGVPTMFIAMLGHEHYERTDFSSLRGGCMAGAPCPVEVMRSVIDRMNMKGVTIAYGMTETSPVSFQTGGEDSLEHRIGTVGRIQPHLESKIVDADGHTVPVGETGELCTRGYSVMQGYWGQPERTEDAIDADGWMHTGDLATIDGQGYCRIVGRIKDMIIRGGENIYPREIEEFLYAHPDIQDVAVIGVPDEKFGEEVCAWIVPRPGAALTDQAVRDFCSGQIAHYKVPRFIRFVDGFPTTVTGKVQKFRMREAMNDARVDG